MPSRSEKPSIQREMIAWMSKLRRWLPTAGLIAAALLTTWVVRQIDGAGPPAAPDRDQDPDFFLENFTTTTTDSSGAIKRQLSARRQLHFHDTDSNELTDPHLVLYHPERTPWHIESERGWISGTGEVVLLLGRVRAWRDDELGVRLIDIRTRDMRILPDTEYGETDKPVLIRSRGNETRGVGMRAYLQESRLELLSQVTTVYRKNTAPASLPLDPNTDPTAKESN